MNNNNNKNIYYICIYIYDMRLPVIRIAPVWNARYLTTVPVWKSKYLYKKQVCINSMRTKDSAPSLLQTKLT